MEEAFALRCSENETVLVAAGKTIAVDKNKGVIKKEKINETIAAHKESVTNTFRFEYIN